MKKTLAFHPLLFAPAAVLSFYVSTVNLYLPDHILMPALAVLLAAAAIWGLMFLWLKEQQLAALVATIVLVSFLFFKTALDALRALLAQWGWRAPCEDVCLSLWLLLAVAAACFAALSRKKLESLTRLLNLVAICLVGMKLSVIALHQVSEPPCRNADISSQGSHVAGARDSRAQKSPDIYYIILDGYANPEVFKKYFNYDNQAFVEALRREGFRVYLNCHSNYQITMQSIPSSLNLNYLNDFIPTLLGTVSSDWWPLDRLMQDHAVARFLRARGYRYIHCSSFWGASNYNPYASKNVECGFPDQFGVELILSTAYGPLERHLHFLRDAMRRRKLAVFAALPDIQKEHGPKFVFVHIVLPHPPYLFKTNGLPAEAGLTPLMDGCDYSLKQPYVEQSEFLEKKVCQSIHEILSCPGDKPVIVLQSDHGPSSTDTNAFNYKPSDAYLGERMRIFNAYFFPGNASVPVYDGITPVNSFREIFNYYFDAGFPILADENFYAPYAAPFKLVNVSQRMKAADEALPGKLQAGSSPGKPAGEDGPRGAD